MITFFGRVMLMSLEKKRCMKFLCNEEERGRRYHSIVIQCFWWYQSVRGVRVSFWCWIRFLILTKLIITFICNAMLLSYEKKEVYDVSVNRGREDDDKIALQLNCYWWYQTAICNEKMISVRNRESDLISKKIRVLHYLYNTLTCVTYETHLNVLAFVPNCLVCDFVH